jgi:hypothetical protein
MRSFCGYRKSIKRYALRSIHRGRTCWQRACSCFIIWRVLVTHVWYMICWSTKCDWLWYFCWVVQTNNNIWNSDCSSRRSDWLHVSWLPPQQLLFRQTTHHGLARDSPDLVCGPAPPASTDANAASRRARLCTRWRYPGAESRWHAKRHMSNPDDGDQLVPQCISAD